MLSESSCERTHAVSNGGSLERRETIAVTSPNQRQRNFEIFGWTSHVADAKFVSKPNQNSGKLWQEMHVQMAIQMGWRDACFKHLQDLGATFGVNILQA